MANSTVPSELRKAAEMLARANREAEPHISRVYLFPAKNEIRLVEVDDTARPSGEYISPFYFGPDESGGIPYPSGIALIRPEEEMKINLETWGNWDDAIAL